MKIPRVKKRKPFVDVLGHKSAQYMESDRDFVDDNRAACVWFLENRDALAEMANAVINVLTDSQLDFVQSDGKTLRQKLKTTN